MQIHYFLEGYDPAPERSLNEPEPRVITEDVAGILRLVVRPDDEDSGASVALIAEKAGVSTRTVYRVLSETTQTISLDLGDRLCLAAEAHISACRLLLPNGEVKGYFDGELGGILKA